MRSGSLPVPETLNKPAQGHFQRNGLVDAQSLKGVVDRRVRALVLVAEFPLRPHQSVEGNSLLVDVLEVDFELKLNDFSNVK